MAKTPPAKAPTSKWRFFATPLTLLVLSLVLLFASQPGSLFKSQLVPSDTIPPTVSNFTVSPNPIAQGAALGLQGTLTDNTSLKDVLFFFTNEDPATIELAEYGNFPACSNNLIAFPCYKALTGPFANPYTFDVNYTLPQGTGMRYVVLAVTDNSNNLGGDYRAFEVIASTSTTTISKLEVSPNNVPKNSTFFVNAKATGPNNLYWFLIFSKQPINALEELSGIQECSKDNVGTHQLPGAQPNCYLWSGEHVSASSIDLSIPFLVTANESSSSYQVYFLATPNLNDLNQYVAQQTSFQIRAAAIPANNLTTIGAGTATFLGTANCPDGNPACVAIGKMHQATKVGALQDFKSETLNHNLNIIKKKVDQGLQQGSLQNPLQVQQVYAQTTGTALYFRDSRKPDGDTDLSYVGQWENRNNMPLAIPEQPIPATINDHLRAQMNIYNNSGSIKKVIVGMVIPEVTGLYPAGRDFNSPRSPFSSAGIYQLGVSSGYFTLPSTLPSWQLPNYNWCYNLQDMLTADPGTSVNKTRAIENPTDQKLYQLMQSPPDITGINLGPGATTCNKDGGNPNFSTNMMDLSYDSSAALFLEQIQYFEIPAGGSIAFNYDKQLYESFYGQWSLYMAVEDGGNYYLVNKDYNGNDKPINSGFFRVTDLRFKPYGALTKTGNDGSVSGWAYDIDDYGKEKSSQLLVVYFNASNPAFLDPINLFSGSIDWQQIAMAYNSNWQSVKANGTGATPSDLRVPSDINNLNYTYTPSATTITTLNTSVQGMNFFVPNSKYLATVWAIDNEGAFSLIGYKDFTYTGETPPGPGPGDHPPTFMPDTFSMSEKNFLADTVAHTVVTSNFSDAAGVNDLKSATIYFLNEFHHLSKLGEAIAAAKVTMPDCSATTDLPCKQVMTATGGNTYMAYTGTASFKPTVAGRKSLLIIARDSQGTEGYKLADFDVAAQNPNNSAPQNVEGGFSLQPSTFLPNTAINSTLTVQFTDADGADDLLQKAEAYFLDQWFHLSNLGDAIDYVNHISTDLPDCSSTLNPPCVVSLTGSAVDETTKAYTAPVSFITLAVNDYSVLVIGKDTQDAKVNKLARYRVTPTGEKNTTPTITPGVAFPDGSPFPGETSIEPPVTLKLAATLNDQESNPVDGVQFLISRGENRLSDASSLTTVCEQDSTGNIINVQDDCYFFTDPNDTLAILEAETQIDNTANNHSTPISFERSVTFSKYGYYHFTVIGREVLDSQTFNWFGNHTLAEALALKLNPISVQPPAVGDVTLNLTVPLQDRDNKPTTDRNTHATKVWLSLQNPAVNTPARVVSFLTDANGFASVQLDDVPLGADTLSVKTDQHLARRLNVNLLAGNNTVTFPVLYGGDIAGTPNSTFTGTFDDVINSVDISELFNNWGNRLGEASYLKLHDLDGNGEVGAEDYSTLISNVNRRGE